MTYSSGMYKKSKPKHEDIKHHFKKRFIQRFNMDLTRDIYDHIMIQIKRNNAELLERQSNTKNVYKVSLPNKNKIVVIYNKKYKLLQTCFPFEWYNNESYMKSNSLRTITKYETSYSGVHYE